MFSCPGSLNGSVQRQQVSLRCNTVDIFQRLNNRRYGVVNGGNLLEDFHDPGRHIHGTLDKAVQGYAGSLSKTAHSIAVQFIAFVVGFDQLQNGIALLIHQASQANKAGAKRIHCVIVGGDDIGQARLAVGQHFC